MCDKFGGKYCTKASKYWVQISANDQSTNKIFPENITVCSNHLVWGVNTLNEIVNNNWTYSNKPIVTVKKLRVGKTPEIRYYQ